MSTIAGIGGSGDASTIVLFFLFCGGKMSSFFGGGAVQTGPSPLSVAKMEADVVMEMFGKMSASCASKCIVKQADGELSVGEMSCIDRCVG